MGDKIQISNIMQYNQNKVPTFTFLHHACLPTCTSFEEYVSLLIGLHKNNGSVSCVVIYFIFI